MLASPSMALMAVILTGPGSTKPDAVTCETGVRHIELPAVPKSETPTICISPGRPTVFSFDAELIADSVSLEARDGFSLVEQSRSTLKLVPSEKLTAGRRLMLTARYRDSAAPTSAALILVVQATQAEPLVNVYRQARSVESYEQELEETREKVRQCREENERLHVEHKGPGGLVGLRVSRLMAEGGVSAMSITERVTPAATNAFTVSDVTVYRSASRVAVEVGMIVPEDSPAWKPEDAMLTLQGKKGVELKVVTLWHSQPSAPNLSGVRVLVEAESPTGAAAGAYLLKLSDASGTRTVALGNVTFP